MKKTYLLVSVLLSAYASAQQTLPFTETFSYPAATNLHEKGPWSALGTPAASDHIVCDGDKAVFEAGGTDAQVLFTSQNSGTVYYSLDLTVTGALASVLDANGGYIAGFNGTSTNNGGSLWVKKDPTDATNKKYAIGVEVKTATGANTTFTPYNYVEGAKYTIVVSYTFNGASATDDVAKLWVNPQVTDENTPLLTDTHTGTDLTSIVSFFLRQDSVTETPGITIDNVKVTNTFAAVLSTDKLDAISGLRVSPNPATTELNITSDSFAVKTVEMYDVLGKLALKTTVTNQALNVAGLAKGVYVVKITEEGKVATRKVVIE